MKKVLIGTGILTAGFASGIFVIYTLFMDVVNGRASEIQKIKEGVTEALSET
jgi:hypothetical protein